VSTGIHPVLAAALAAATGAYRSALATYPRDELARDIGLGGDGTLTTRLDELVDTAVLDAVAPLGVNVLSEEIGWVDHGSAMTLVVDPLDGTANATAGVPICAFAGALAVDGVFTKGLVSWLDLGRRWHARRGDRFATVTGRTSLSGASVSMLRPRAATLPAWTRVATRADRVRVLGSSVIEACLVADGAVDAFVDCGGDVHRLVDLAASKVIVEAAGGVVRDLHDRAIEFDIDLSRRWSGIAACSQQVADEITRIVSG